MAVVPARYIFVGFLACLVLVVAFAWIGVQRDTFPAAEPIPSNNDDTAKLIKNDPFASEIFDLYNSYSEDLNRTRALIWKWRFSVLGRTKACYGSLSEMEAELLYLRIRKRQPSLVLEIAPLCGFSTMYILSALRDNGFGTLYSFDLVPNARQMVDKELAATRWVFTQGDVTKKANAEQLDKQWDFIFIDAAHNPDFAKWYTENVFTPHLTKIVEEKLPPTPVQVHDIYSPALVNPGRSCFLPNPAESFDALYPHFTAPPEFHLQCLQEKNVNYSAPSAEGRVVVAFLEKCATGSIVEGGISRKQFDISYYSRRDLWSATQAIRKKALQLGEWSFISVNYINPSVYFEFSLQQ